MEAIRNMVVAGLGVTILSDMVYRPWPLEGARLDAMSDHARDADRVGGVRTHADAVCAHRDVFARQRRGLALHRELAPYLN